MICSAHASLSTSTHPSVFPFCTSFSCTPVCMSFLFLLSSSLFFLSSFAVYPPFSFLIFCPKTLDNCCITIRRIQTSSLSVKLSLKSLAMNIKYKVSLSCLGMLVIIMTVANVIQWVKGLGLGGVPICNDITPFTAFMLSGCQRFVCACVFVHLIQACNISCGQGVFECTQFNT